MAKKLYVGGLSYDTTEDTLKKTFAEAGTVETAVVIMDRMSGRSKGFGFVEMENQDAAQKAMEELNGQDYEGRALKIDEARPPKKRMGGGGGGGFGGGGGGGGGGFRGNRGGGGGFRGGRF